MTEQWHRWEPIEGLGKKYFAGDILDTKNGFSMLLIECGGEKQKQVKIDFSHTVYSYRKVVEGFRIELYLKLNEHFPKLSYGDWSFFKVNSSGYVHWLNKESDSIATRYSLYHYCFMLDDSIIDVIATKEPKVTILKNES